MVNRLRTGLCAAITQLIRRIADNHIKFHIVRFQYLLRPIAVNKGVGVVFQFIIIAVVHFLACTAILTFSALPSMMDAPIADIALRVFAKLGTDG